MENKRLDAFLEKLMTRARKAGFTAAEAYVQTGESARVSVFEGEVTESKLAASLGVSFRALVNGRVGYASTEALDDEALDLLIACARDNAGTVRSEDEEFIYKPDGSAYASILDAYDPSLAALTPGALIEHCLHMERTAKALDARVLRMSQCIGFSGDGRVRIVNTQGLDVSFSDNLAYLYAGPVVKNGEAMSSGGAFWAGNEIGKVDPDAVAKEAVEDALAYIGAKPVPSGNYPVIFRREAMASLLDVFSGIFSAEKAQRGLSRLAGREGAIIAAPCVTLLDDPHRRRGFASRPFDDEGVATQVKRVIDGGNLTTLLHNLKTANKQGVKTTGNACKAGYTAPVSVAPFNFYLEPGAPSLDALLAQMNNGLLIAELNGLHAGANAVSGDFSLLAKGFLIENGQILRPVDQITVAGNFFDLLKTIVAPANDLWFDLPGGAGACGSPSVLVEGVSVAG